MQQEFAEKRSDFRAPIVLPVEYFTPDESGIVSFTLDLSRNGAFISSDDPLVPGNKFPLHLTIPVDYESSKIYRTRATVAWNNMQPFKSKTNGMGVSFVEPLPESLLLNALAHNTRKLIKETDAKKRLEEKLEKFESEREEIERLAALGRCVEKILFELSNPIVSLSGRLVILKGKLDEHKRRLEEHKETNKKAFKRVLREFNSVRKEIDHILNDYKIIVELAEIIRDDRETLGERLLERYDSPG